MHLFTTEAIEEQNYSGSSFFGYRMNASDIFSEADYNAMQKLKDPPLLRCMKVSHNGKTELCYDASRLFSLSDSLATNKINDLVDVFLKVNDALTQIQKIGYLSVCNVLPLIEKIFLDPKTDAIKLVYLPLTKELFSSRFIFEEKLKHEILKLFENNNKVLSVRDRILKENLNSGELTLKEITDLVKPTIPVSPVRRLYLQSMDKYQPFSVEVNKDDFVIGRNSTVCDYLLNINEQISRIHCQIQKRANDYSLIDLSSKFGTFLNGERLTPQQPYPIKNNDIIGIAGVVSFTIIIS